MISSWTTLLQHDAGLVPTQSVPVSPPPMTTTSLPVALSSGIGAVELVVELVARVGREELHREVHALGVTVLDREITAKGSTATESGFKVLTELLSGPLGVLR